MSTTYNGKAGNESRLGALSITGTATAAGLIEVTTSAHGLLTGDRVTIVGHGVVATGVGKEANGTWTVTATSSTKFTLNGSTYVGNGGATGTATYLGLMPHTTIPADGDPLTAASVGVVCEDAKDSQAYIAERLGAWRMVSHTFVCFTSTANTAFLGAAGGAGAWGAYDATFDANATTLLANGGYVYFEPGDVIEMELSFGASTGGPGTCVIGLFGETCEYGVATTYAGTAFGTSNMVNGAAQVPTTVRALKTMSGTRGARIYPTVKAYGIGGASSVAGNGGFTFSIKVWRAN